MASKRMIAKMVIDSDAFLDMPQSSQNLYFHLNLHADDEGFVDNPKKVMRVIGSSQNDLEILLAKRYVLGFESGVIVIKHWKLHNCIRKDRVKETIYQEEKESISEKENGVYTDKEACQEDDGQLSDNCQPTVTVDQYSIDQNRLDKSSTDDVQMYDKCPDKNPPEIEPLSISVLINKTIDHWNGKGFLPKCRFTSATFPMISDVTLKYDMYSYPEIEKAIDNLAELYEKEEVKYRPSALHKFLVNSLERWVDDGNPHARYAPDKKTETPYRPYVPEKIDRTDEEWEAGAEMLKQESMAEQVKRLAAEKNMGSI